MVQPPIKHIVNSNALGQASGANTVIIAKGVLNPDPYTNNTDVKAANKIFGVTVQIDYTPAQNAPVGDYLFDWYIGFNINGAQPMPTVGNTGASHINSQIFHEDGAIQQNGAVTASTVGKTWRFRLALPKSWSSFNDGDQLEFHYLTAGPASAAHDIKWKFIFKEIYP